MIKVTYRSGGLSEEFAAKHIGFKDPLLGYIALINELDSDGEYTDAMVVAYVKSDDIQSIRIIKES